MIAARAFGSAPFTESLRQVFVAGSVNPGPAQPVYGPMVFRAALMHFDTHFALAPVILTSAEPVPFSHFCSSLFGSVTGGNCASTGRPSSPRPAAAATAIRTFLDMAFLPSVVGVRSPRTQHRSSPNAALREHVNAKKTMIGARSEGTSRAGGLTRSICTGFHWVAATGHHEPPPRTGDDARARADQLHAGRSLRRIVPARGARRRRRDRARRARHEHALVRPGARLHAAARVAGPLAVRADRAGPH